MATNKNNTSLLDLVQSIDHLDFEVSCDGGKFQFGGTFIIDKAGIVRWSVVNSPAEARNLADYKTALASL